MAYFNRSAVPSAPPLRPDIKTKLDISYELSTRLYQLAKEVTSIDDLFRDVAPQEWQTQLRDTFLGIQSRMNALSAEYRRMNLAGESIEPILKDPNKLVTLLLTISGADSLANSVIELYAQNPALQNNLIHAYARALVFKSLYMELGISLFDEHYVRKEGSPKKLLWLARNTKPRDG